MCVCVCSSKHGMVDECWWWQRFGWLYNILWRSYSLARLWRSSIHLWNCDGPGSYWQGLHAAVSCRTNPDLPRKQDGRRRTSGESSRGTLQPTSGERGGGLSRLRLSTLVCRETNGCHYQLWKESGHQWDLHEGSEQPGLCFRSGCCPGKVTSADDCAWDSAATTGSFFERWQHPLLAEFSGSAALCQSRWGSSFGVPTSSGPRPAQCTGPATRLQLGVFLSMILAVAFGFERMIWIDLDGAASWWTSWQWKDQQDAAWLLPGWLLLPQARLRSGNGPGGWTSASQLWVKKVCWVQVQCRKYEYI